MHSAITTEGARLDVAANGFWGGRYEKTFIDVRVLFNPYVPSNRNTTLTQCYRKHELEKKRSYEQRIREVEHASLSASGGIAKGATKDLPQCSQSYSSTIGWLRCTIISFSLLRSAVQCIRGARSSKGKAARSDLRPC